MHPTKVEEDKLQYTVDICREIYNHCVFESRVAYKEADDKCLTEGKEKVAQPVVNKFLRNLSVMNALRKRKKE